MARPPRLSTAHAGPGIKMCKVPSQLNKPRQLCRHSMLFGWAACNGRGPMKSKCLLALSALLVSGCTQVNDEFYSKKEFYQPIIRCRHVTMQTFGSTPARPGLLARHHPHSLADQTL
jgi:hypothetical protein